MRLDPSIHEQKAFEALKNGNYDEMLHHARHIPHNWDIYQRLPSTLESGLPNEAFHKIMDSLPENHPNRSSFLFEYGQNLPSHATPNELNRAARAVMGDDWISRRKFLDHPNWQRDENDNRLHKAANFWQLYEKMVDPSHFAAIKSLHSGKPEVFSDYRNIGGHGSSGDWESALPHLRGYSKKVQEKILKDPHIIKRDFKGEPYIRVHRGLGGHYAKALKEAAGYNRNDHSVDAKQIVVPKAPFSSWTTDKREAERFAHNRSQMPNQPAGHGMTITKWMPVKDILHSGFHYVYPEQEHVHPSEQEIIFQHPKGKMKLSTNEMALQTSQEPYTPLTKPNLRSKSEKLEKGVKDRVIQLATAASMLGAPSIMGSYDHIAPKLKPAASAEQKESVNPHPDLDSIEMIESAGGKNTRHPKVNYGLNAGTSAVGLYGLMPLQVQDTLQYDKKLGRKYPELLTFDPIKESDKMHQILNKDPNVQKEIANSHWRRLGRTFHNDKAKMAHAWIAGITGTKNATDEEIANHPYVQKYFKYQKMKQLENPLAPLRKSQDLQEKTRNIKKFIPSNPADKELGLKLTDLIQNDQVHDLSNEGHFTHSSFVVGNDADDAWLLKLESENRPGIQSAQYGLQVVKEAAFYDTARQVFGLGDYTPPAILGEIEKKSPNSDDNFEFVPAVAIKMLPPEYKLAVDMQEDHPGSVKGILEPYRRSGLLHKIAAMYLILGEADAHGSNFLVSPEGGLSMIDHGTSFADERFNPATDDKIFIPYILRVGDVKNKMSPEEKNRNLKTINNPAANQELKTWILSLDEDKLKQMIASYDIDPKPMIDRLMKLKQDVTNNPADLTINKWWTLGFQLA
jgi:hypothetical protein